MLRIVLAEDEKYVRKGIVNRIDWNALGYETVIEASTGTDALSRVLESNAHVLITDIKMPCMDGIALISAIKAAGIPTRCIIISGYDDFGYAQTAIRLGIFDYLTKPIDINELARALSSLRDQIEPEVRADPGRTSAPGETMPNDDAMDNVRQYIRSHFTQPISGQTLSAQFFLNPTYLSHCFKQKFGIGISQYLETLRVERAKELLLAGYRVSQVSEMVGYGDASYFTRVFRRNTGQSPAQFHESYHGAPQR